MPFACYAMASTARYKSHSTAEQPLLMVGRRLERRKAKLYEFEIWIDGRVYGRIEAETATEASQTARRLWPDQIEESKEFRIEQRYTKRG